MPCLRCVAFDRIYAGGFLPLYKATNTIAVHSWVDFHGGAAKNSRFFSVKYWRDV